MVLDDGLGGCEGLAVGVGVRSGVVACVIICIFGFS